MAAINAEQSNSSYNLISQEKHVLNWHLLCENWAQGNYPVSNSDICLSLNVDSC